VADGLDVVTVGVEHERAVVLRVILGTDAGRAVVLAAGGDRRLVERADLGATLRTKRDVHAIDLALAGSPIDPEIGLAADPVPGELLERHDQAVPQRCERPLVEGLAAREVGDLDPDVIDHGAKITSARKQSKLATVRAVTVVLALLAVPGVARAGRSQYGWLYGSEVLPEKSVEVQQWVYERNGINDPPKTRDTLLWWGVLIGLTDQLELALPIEFLWRDVAGMGSNFTVEKFGAELRYRFTKLDFENPDGVAPLLRVAVKRDVIVRDVVLAEGDFVLAYQDGRFHGQVDLGAAAAIGSDNTVFELRPGAGVSIETKKGLRFGAEAYAEWFVDSDLKNSRWAGVGPNMSWTSGRFWLTASFLVGVYQIDTAPRVVWGVLF